MEQVEIVTSNLEIPILGPISEKILKDLTLQVPMRDSVLEMVVLIRVTSTLTKDILEDILQEALVIILLQVVISVKGQHFSSQ